MTGTPKGVFHRGLAMPARILTPPGSVKWRATDSAAPEKPGASRLAVSGNMLND